MRLSEAFQSYSIAARASGLSPKTVSNVEQTVTHLARAYPVEVEHLVKEDLRLFLANPRWAKTTKLIHWKNMKRLFEFCVEEDILARNPLEGVERPKNADKARKPPMYSEVELEGLLAACPDWTDTGRRDRAILSVLFTTPARIGEVCAIRLEDIDWAGERVILHGKGNTVYTAVLFPKCARELDRYIRRRKFDRPFLFVSRDGLQLGTHAVQQILRRLRLRAGLDKPLYAHALRHRFGMNTVRWGLATDEAMYALGHRSDHATKIYRQWVASEEALKKIRAVAETPVRRVS